MYNHYSYISKMYENCSYTLNVTKAPGLYISDPETTHKSPISYGVILIDDYHVIDDFYIVTLLVEHNGCYYSNDLTQASRLMDEFTLEREWIKLEDIIHGDKQEENGFVVVDVMLGATSFKIPEMPLTDMIKVAIVKSDYEKLLTMLNEAMYIFFNKNLIL